MANPARPGAGDTAPVPPACWSNPRRPRYDTVVPSRDPVPYSASPRVTRSTYLNTERRAFSAKVCASAWRLIAPCSIARSQAARRRPRGASILLSRTVNAALCAASACAGYATIIDAMSRTVMPFHMASASILTNSSAPRPVIPAPRTAPCRLAMSLTCPEGRF